ncbi:uncharacterized protein LOC123262621 [Cotesia glomerata]|uniref:uncharacterized protein LOC123262621 n=1 Tax=Cotesia glomerata TaxID=32391 RepID=UPI001D02D0BE|nr:uncharacterized protein LOC123262621 [Cotesia glomerata]
MKLLIVLGLVAVTFAAENKTISARSDDIDLIDQTEDNSAGNLQKRESGYLYSRPRPSFPSRIKNIKNKRPGHVVRPFMTYGPPKSPAYSPSKNKYQNVNSNRPNPQYQTPDPLKIVEFTKPSPIASQNEEPFKATSANYLPPKNQKLPTHPATYFQQSQNFQSQQLLQNPPNLSSQISDAAQFLRQNAPAISQLYKAPATNQNYEPLPEQNPTISSRSHQSEALPSYASGTLEPYRSLQQIQSLEKDQLIAELRQQLATVHDSQRYATEQGHFFSNLDTQSNKGLIIGQSAYGPPTASDQPALETQNTNQGNSVPTSFGIPAAFPFPQYAGGLTPVIGGTNFVTGTSLPTFFGSNAPGQIDSPTHFSLPIPSNNKPLTPANTKPSFPSLHPVYGTGGHYPALDPHPQLQPLPHPQPQPQPIHPIQTVHPVHPVQPVLGVQTAPVSPVILKPVKPVFPVYYPSVPYVIQKPSLAAPSYSVIKSAQIW